MSTPIRFFRKSFIDTTHPGVQISASKSGDLGKLVRDRRNDTGWVANNATPLGTEFLTLNWVDVKTVTHVFLLNHNLANGGIRVFDSNNPSTEEFIIFTNNTETNGFFTLTNSGPYNAVTVTFDDGLGNATIDGNDPKISQIVVTEQLGQLEGFPVINRPTLDRNLNIGTALSGKSVVTANTGGYSFELQITVTSSENDTQLLQDLHLTNNGFLTLLNGGDEDQFNLNLLGYRTQDLLFTKITSDFSAQLFRGVYTLGQEIRVKFAEVIN